MKITTINKILCAVTAIVVLLFLVIKLFPSLRQSGAVVEVTFKAPRADKLYVFYDKGNGFADNDSVRVDYSESEDFITERFELNNIGRIRRIRLDFGILNNSIEVREIRILYRGAPSLEFGPERLSRFYRSDDVKIISSGADAIVIKISGVDAYIVSGKIRPPVQFDLIGLSAILFSMLLSYRLYSWLSGLSFDSTGGVAALLTASVFVIFLFMPLFQSVFHKLDEKVLDENRNLSRFPEASKGNIMALPALFDKYVNDHVAFRGNLITLKDFIFLEVFSVQPGEDKAPHGLDGWIFLIDSLEEPVLNSNELQVVSQRIRDYKERFAKQGIKYYFLVPPDKHSIYSEFLPERFYYDIYADFKKTNLENLMEIEDKDDSFEILDFQGAIRAKKKGCNLYLQKDSHWNQYGAYIAYLELVERIARDFPVVKAIRFDGDMCVYSPSPTIGDLAHVVVKGEKATETNYIDLAAIMGLKYAPEKYTPKHFKTRYILKKAEIAQNPEKSNMPRALVFSDSFFIAMEPFLSNTFSETLVVWYEEPNTNIIEQGFIDEFKPDIIIHEIVERNLPRLLNDAPLIKASAL